MKSVYRKLQRVKSKTNFPKTASCHGTLNIPAIRPTFSIIHATRTPLPMGRSSPKQGGPGLISSQVSQIIILSFLRPDENMIQNSTVRDSCSIKNFPARRHRRRSRIGSGETLTALVSLAQRSRRRSALLCHRTWRRGRFVRRQRFVSSMCDLTYGVAPIIHSHRIRACFESRKDPHL